MINGMITAMKATGDTFAQLASRRMTREDIAQYIIDVTPTPENQPIPDSVSQRRRDIGLLVWAGKGAEMAGADANGGTAWGAYNAVVEYFDHVRPGKAHAASAVKSANESALFGAGAVAKSLAFAKARQLVTV